MVKDAITRRTALGCLIGALAAPRTAAAASDQQPITPRMFGAAGDGRTDDTAAIEAALASQLPIDWQGLHYRLARPINHTAARDLTWRGNGARITFDPADHAEFAIRLRDTTGLNFLIMNLAIDGGKKANKPLEILNNTSMATASTFVANALRVSRAKRSSAFAGGDGVFIRGAFDSVTFNGGKVWDCELPAGQGTAAIVGVTGITVMHYSATSFVRRCVLSGLEIEKIYSSNLHYQGDQDGIRYFGPDEASPSGKVDTTLIVTGGASFRNCYGRSIKTQCRNTIVQSSFFMRDEGLASGAGNVEIDAQTGPLNVEGLEFRYSNGQQPTACIRAINAVGYGPASLNARACKVFVAEGTTLKAFASTYSLSGEMVRHSVADITIRGAVEVPVEMLVSGPANFIEVSDCDLDEISESAAGGPALVSIRRSGTKTPTLATVIAHDNVYRGAETVALIRDTIRPASATLSAWDNLGFN